MNLIRRGLRVPKSLPLTDDEVGDIDDRIDLWRAIRTLPNRERHAILLHYRADMPVDHIAIVMGCAPSTARAHLARGRQKLRKWLNDVVDKERPDVVHITRDPELGS